MRIVKLTRELSNWHDNCQMFYVGSLMFYLNRHVGSKVSWNFCHILQNKFRVCFRQFSLLLYNLYTTQSVREERISVSKGLHTLITVQKWLRYVLDPQPIKTMFPMKFSHGSIPTIKNIEIWTLPIDTYYNVIELFIHASKLSIGYLPISPTSATVVY